MTTNVYEQYFAAQAEYNGLPRHAALVMLIADSEAGQIRYEAAVSFFPHYDEAKAPLRVPTIYDIFAPKFR